MSLEESGSGGTLNGGLLQGVGNDLLGKMQVVSQILNTGISEGKVLVLPSISLLDELSGEKRLHQLNNVQKGDTDLLVLGHVVGLLGDEGTVLEEIRVDGKTILLRD